MTNSNKYVLTNTKLPFKISLMKNGYIRCLNKNRDYLHRWLFNNPSGVIHHKDGNKWNNTYDNLKCYISNGEHHRQEHEIWNKGLKHDKSTCVKLSQRALDKRTTWHGFRYATHETRMSHTNKPWKLVYRFGEYPNRKSKHIGFFEDPLSCEIVSVLIDEAI